VISARRSTVNRTGVMDLTPIHCSQSPNKASNPVHERHQSRRC
jgi:hypothetical protein